MHSFYLSSSPSGENEVVRAELAALRAGGHDVELFARSSDEGLEQPGYRLRSAARVATGRGDHPGDAVAAFAPDVVHVHNTFPNLGHAWLRRLSVPFVHTVHNYRPFCAAGEQFRDGEVCRLCTDQGSWNAVRHRCYHGSAIASVPLAIRTARGPAADPLFASAAAIVVLTQQMHDQLVAAGVPGDKLERWPNFLPDHLDPVTGTGEVRPAGAREGFAVVGRFVPAKGIAELVRSWPEGVPLTVVGSGPDEGAIRAAAAGRPAIDVRGRLPRPEVLDLMGRSRALLIPSRWYEGAPVIYPEALACGTPVLATDPSAVALQADADGTGRRFPDLGALLTAVAAPLDLPAPARVRATFEQRYTEAAYRRRAEALYGRVAAERR